LNWSLVLESNQKKLSRVRSPRVHITYDVDIGDAIVQRELPLIVGILADLSGNPAEALPPLKDRSFVVIDRDNFDDVMTGCGVRLTYKVDDAISSEEGAKTNLALKFKCIEDFEPINLVKQIPITNDLYKSRSRIRDLMAKLDGNDPLDGLFTELLNSEELQTALITLYADAEDMSAVTPDDFVNRMLSKGRMALDESQKPYALELIGEFALSIIRDTPSFYVDNCDAQNPLKSFLTKVLEDETLKSKLIDSYEDAKDILAVNLFPFVESMYKEKSLLIDQIINPDALKLIGEFAQSILGSAEDKFLTKYDDKNSLHSFFKKILADDNLKTQLTELYADLENVSEENVNTFIDSMISEKNLSLDSITNPSTLKLIGGLALSILRNNIPYCSDRMSDKIAVIDNQLTQQINLVMHEPVFQTLEATWRGLHFLVMNTETGATLKLRVLNVSKTDLLKDLQKAVEFDQSALFKKVYEDEFGTYGGDPFSFLVGDYEFGRHPEDIELLEKISGVAAAAHAPFISSAYSKLFDMEDYFSLSQPRDLTKIFESAELIKWRSFRGSEDSRYVTLTLPKVLLRLPYGPETVVAEGFDFIEDVDGTNAKKYLWGNPAFVLGQRITNAFSKHGWLAAIRGVEGGGLVEGLPAHTFKTEAGDIKLTCPTQVSITDRREKELNDLGFMAILHCKGSDKAAFFGGQTTGLAQKYNTDAANANARISTMLPYVLNASRFAHYIKVIMRDKIGSFLTKDNVSDYLNNWMGNYVLVDDSAPQEMKASYPLRDSRIDVSDVPGKPGSYRAVVFLRPHFQLEELTTSIRLVAELP